MFQKKYFSTAFIAAALCLGATEANASAVAWLNTVTQKFIVRSEFYFYGDQATTSVVEASMREIEQMWNEPKVFYISKGRQYPIEFQFAHTLEVKPQNKTYDPNVFGPRLVNPAMSTYVHLPIRNDFFENGEWRKNSSSYLKLHPEMNMIQITGHDKKYDNRSNYNCGGQIGKFLVSDDLGLSTTAAHEFGHGLGLSHVEGSICMQKNGPSIMCARGAITLPEFQYNPSAKAGSAKGGTLNPYYRKVTADDIMALRLSTIVPNKKGIKIVGPHLAKECGASKI